MNSLYKEWVDAFTRIGTPIIGRDTAARILAVVCVHGNNEAFVDNEKFITDINHIKSVWHIDGGETPETDMVELINRYITELEEYRDLHKEDHTGDALFKNPAPEWAHKLFADRYQIKLIN